MRKRKGPYPWVKKGEVVSGLFIFWLHDTHGMPIEVTFELLAKRKLIPDCQGLFQEMVRCGWNRQRAQARIQDACYDTGYPAKVYEETE